VPRLQHALPRYRLHRASGQAVVTIGGRDHYLGPFGSEASYRARDRLIAQWLADGRQTQQAEEPAPAKTVNDLAAAYWRHASDYYRQEGEPTGELGLIKLALRRLCTVYGELAAESLSPTALRDLQQRMIDENLARSYINKLIARIRRMYKWGVAEFGIVVTAYQTLSCVPGLKKGRTAARETAPIRPVSDEVVHATLPHLPAVVADMVRLQRLLGCRPQDVCNLRPGDLETEGDVWWYVPHRHKTAYLDQERRIAVGPRAQTLLANYLNRPAERDGGRRAAPTLARSPKRPVASVPAS
jgi:integrase